MFLCLLDTIYMYIHLSIYLEVELLGHRSYPINHYTFQLVLVSDIIK